MVQHNFFKDDAVDPKVATRGILNVCNVQRKKFTSTEYTRCRSGRGGGLGKVDLEKVSSYGRVGFESVRKRLEALKAH